MFLGLLAVLVVPGFAMIEAGMARVQNSSLACLKTAMIFALAGASYALLGMNIAQHGLISGILEFISLVFGADAPSPEFFFQMLLAVTACLIIAGPVAERVRLWPLLFFCCIFAGVIFPVLQDLFITQNYLGGLGFSDLGGVNLMHMSAGIAALVAVKIAGPRPSRYADPQNSQAQDHALPGNNMPLAALGTFLLWIGLTALHSGAYFLQDLTFETAQLSRTILNAYLGSAGGAIAAFWLLTFRHGKADLTLVFNAMLAGLVSTASISIVAYPLLVFIIGGIGGILCLITVSFLDRLRLDDVTGAISIHGVGGAWAMLVAIAFNISGILGQIAGLILITMLAAGLSTIVLILIKASIGLCCSERASRHGQDAEEVGVQAYPQFEIRRTGF
ncbi:MAG: ammonium transporter [Alphaproteobacteria bacterium]|nr:ammonium transporter [Alphaproteobacteria bacterium]